MPPTTPTHHPASITAEPAASTSKIPQSSTHPQTPDPAIASEPVLEAPTQQHTVSLPTIASHPNPSVPSTIFPAKHTPTSVDLDTEAKVAQSDFIQTEILRHLDWTNLKPDQKHSYKPIPFFLPSNTAFSTPNSAMPLPGENAILAYSLADDCSKVQGHAYWMKTEEEYARVEKWVEGKGKDWGIWPKIFWLVENGKTDRVGGVAADKE